MASSLAAVTAFLQKAFKEKSLNRLLFLLYDSLTTGTYSLIQTRHQIFSDFNGSHLFFSFTWLGDKITEKSQQCPEIAVNSIVPP